MKKIVSILVAGILISSGVLQNQVQAAAPIGIYINGVKLSTDQAPIMVSNRALLPLRAIFEALDANVDWNQQTKVVTANKDGKTIVLKLGAKTATINNSIVALDVPVQSVKGRTMIPVRFVSEALGEVVDWNSTTQRVTITTSIEVNPVSYVNVRVNGQVGNGSDLVVNFPKAVKENSVGEYRIFVVKSAISSNFDLARAVSNNNYISVPVQGRDVSLTLSSQAKDSSGELVRANQSYNVYVLTVGKGSTPSALSSASQTVTLTMGSPVASVTSVSATDVSDYSDGRDMRVTFTKPQTDSNIANYRVMVVKTAVANKFDIITANGVTSNNFTTVSKSGTTLTTTLTSSSRDSSGELIKNGVPYTVFVLSVSGNLNSNPNKLSSGSSSITLNNNPLVAPVITKVEDVNGYGDGRDLRVSFNKISDESRIGSYRIFVVKENNAYNFNLKAANAVSSANYTNVTKTGYNISQTLASIARDVDGLTIRNGVSYRVFVMSVGTGNYSGSNVLSSYSSIISLSGNNVNSVNNIIVNDVSDNSDGRDLRVSFNKVNDESILSHYRVMVVKSGNANSFNLSSANAVSSSNYTYVSKTGYNISQSLSSNARDVNGETIKNGVSYRVFVLSVGVGSSAGSNALSSYSSAITLAGNYKVNAVSNLAVSDASDFNDGRDLKVSFNRITDESTISQYRVMVVKTGNEGKFNLTVANALSSSNYTIVSKTGNNIINQILGSNTKDVEGETIKNGVSYRVVVLSVGTGNYNGSNALSSYSSPITLAGDYKVTAVTNLGVNDVSDYKDGRDLEVSFNRITDESTISEYRVMVVKKANEGKFNLAIANKLPSTNYNVIVKKGANIRQSLTSDAKDVDGAKIINGESYLIYVLSVGTGNYTGNNILSSKSDITLSSAVVVDGVTNLSATSVGKTGNASDIQVVFTSSANESLVQGYRIMVVKSSEVDSFDLNKANNVNSGNYTDVSKQQGGNISLSLPDTAKDSNGELITTGIGYRVFVLTLANGTVSTVNALTAADGLVEIATPPTPVPTPVPTPAPSDETAPTEIPKEII